MPICSTNYLSLCVMCTVIAIASQPRTTHIIHDSGDDSQWYPRCLPNLASLSHVHLVSADALFLQFDASAHAVMSYCPPLARPYMYTICLSFLLGKTKLFAFLLQLFVHRVWDKRNPWLACHEMYELCKLDRLGPVVVKVYHNIFHSFCHAV